MNTRIYAMTFISNFILGTVSVFGINGAIHIASKDSRASSLSNIVAWIIILCLPTAFIVLNSYCFKYCKTHKAGDWVVYLLNSLMVFSGAIVPFVLYFLVIAFLIKR